MIEKLGITPGQDGWDEDKCEMLEALIDSCKLYEHNVKIKYAKYGVVHDDYHNSKALFEKTKNIIEKATGKAWSNIRE